MKHSCGIYLQHYTTGWKMQLQNIFSILQLHAPGSGWCRDSGQKLILTLADHIILTVHASARISQHSHHHLHIINNWVHFQLSQLGWYWLTKYDIWEKDLPSNIFANFLIIKCKSSAAGDFLQFYGVFYCSFSWSTLLKSFTVVKWTVTICQGLVKRRYHY